MRLNPSSNLWAKERVRTSNTDFDTAVEEYSTLRDKMESICAEKGLPIGTSLVDEGYLPDNDNTRNSTFQEISIFYTECSRGESGLESIAKFLEMSSQEVLEVQKRIINVLGEDYKTAHEAFYGVFYGMFR